MKKHVLNNYIAERLRSIEENLISYKKKKEPECLHRLRVDIKKIKAVFSFAEKIYKEEYSIKALKLLFHKAGDIRELQINIRLLVRLPHSDKKLIAQLKEKEKGFSLKFTSNISRHVKCVRNFRKNISLPSTLPEKKAIRKYFKKQMNKANKKLQKEDRESMHYFRMRIKQIMYVHSALPKKIQREVKLNEGYIEKLQNTAGHWHDTYTAIDFLSHQGTSHKILHTIVKLKEKEARQFKTLSDRLKNFKHDFSHISK